MIDHRSYAHNLNNCEIKAWKTFRPERDLNPWPLRYRWSALPTDVFIFYSAVQVYDLLRATHPWKTLTLARASRWRLRHPSKLLITTHHYRWWQRSLFGHHLSCDVINFFKPRPLFNSSANAAIWLVERLARHFLLAPDWLGPPKSVVYYYLENANSEKRTSETGTALLVRKPWVRRSLM